MVQEQEETYLIRLVGVFHQQSQFLITHKALEAAATRVFFRLDHWLSILPFNVLCPREKRSEQRVLAAYRDIDVTTQEFRKGFLTQINRIAG